MQYRTFLLSSMNILAIALMLFAFGCKSSTIVYSKDGNKMVENNLNEIGAQINVNALKENLSTQLKLQDSIILIVDTECSGCIDQKALPQQDNKTGLPTLVIAENPIDSSVLGKNVAFTTRNHLQGLPVEAYMAAPIGIFLDFKSNKATVKPGPFRNWDECYKSLVENRG